MDNLDLWKKQMNVRPLFGCFVTFGLPDIAEFTAALGFDFLLIDNEHGVIDQSTLCDMVRASQCEGVPAVVRCTENTYSHVQKALDLGANGVQIPLVNTVEDVVKAVSLSNYVPNGKRGIAYQPRASRYGLTIDKQDYLVKANQSKLLSIHIETVQAIENLDEILTIEGVDVYFIGPNDLSANMQLSSDHPKVSSTIHQAITKITTAGKIAGIFVTDVKSTNQAIEWGARYLVTSITPYMAKGAASYLENVRKIVR
ncbi:MAG: aldolase/citrate lyase family protein [Bacteroidales bacterium]|nr:aldolase/citrate lyase family protein [Bacteroidales bacterium]